MRYTTGPDATDDELNQRIPLSMARWRHINYCEAPDRISDYQAAHPKFGMFGS